MAADFDQIVALAETALNDPEISKDPQLVKLLTKIGEAAMNKQYFYDDRRKFQPTVSMYALAHHHHLPPVLLTLLKVVQTPNAWGGF
ncbi:bacteriocin immunity protein [Lacticaseibacillus manihotivorans]|jgi:hypothetical protein|uniref:Bacteriocin immunity protein n=2 Tax=Lacticaseibacillus manihotivorans TaxID=88233 RepID=A0A0R1R5R1_9LACO|nr:bacteriocin immunity protein [Lacticaseibacillus manihotivorans]KRL52343.1 hypothetical protein FD01_GL002452 [Lacticaseibacillus manihotivorans DSM 13343 = JCM 12514]QFQ89989.1 bacteriocin immunity protein [Lacticaseibacillus manihotivorans]